MDPEDLGLPPRGEMTPWQQDIIDSFMSGKPFVTWSLETHFRARRAAKNRTMTELFVAAMTRGEHAHLVTPDTHVCSLVEPCPGSIGYADWIRDA